MTATRGWNPQRTWVVVVGILEWQQTDQFGSFPKAKRRDAALVRVFEQAGVPPAQIVYLRDEQATYAAIDETLTRHLAGTQPGDLLFFYYCGHGYIIDAGVACLACYDAGAEDVPAWKMGAVPRAIERAFGGDRALLALDCCHSGCLADSVAGRKGAVSYACLTSSSASELSTPNWTFTEGLLAGLSGAAFCNSDGSPVITLQELGEQILGDMAFVEEQLASFVTTGTFDPGLVLAPAQPKPDPAVGRRVEVHSGQSWYKARIIDAADGQFKVHYYGWEDTDDEWVTPAQIRKGITVHYAVGQPVEVRWKGKWYPATVLAVRGGVHYIQYDGYGAEWNEWDGAMRLRPPQG